MTDILRLLCCRDLTVPHLPPMSSGALKLPGLAKFKTNAGQDDHDRLHMLVLWFEGRSFLLGRLEGSTPSQFICSLVAGNSNVSSHMNQLRAPVACSKGVFDAFDQVAILYVGATAESPSVSTPLVLPIFDARNAVLRVGMDAEMRRSLRDKFAGTKDRRQLGSVVRLYWPDEPLGFIQR